MYKNYDFCYVGQSTPDYLGRLSISEDLFNKHAVDDSITIGGGYNGGYMLCRVVFFDEDGGLLGCDESTNETGIDDIVELIDALQDSMGHDGGGFIKLRFLQGLKETASPEDYKQVLENLRYPVQEYSGGSSVDPPH